MNHFFKLVWSRSLGMLVPVPEVSRSLGHGGRSSARARRRLAKQAMHGAGLGALAVLAPASAYALPQGGSVASGKAGITTNANTLTVNQTSSKAIINWQKFSVGAGETVNFQQPGTSSIALNRVLGNDPSQIFGRLTANGQIFLVNPNGIVFGPGAQVNVGGLVASTLDITDQNFLSGNYQFSGLSTASVVNYGKIKTFDGGYVAFIGNNVDNEGIIKTPGGTAALGAGGSVALTLAGNSLVSYQVTTAALNAAVKNGGAIVAPNGVVLLTAQAKNALLQTVVNNTGLIQANGASSNGGVVTLLGGTSGTVAVSGTIKANSTSGTGGTVVISGVNTAVSGTARISATGGTGGGTIAIGGGVHGGGGIAQAVTTSVDSGAEVDASATGSGPGGTISVWSDVTNPNSVTTVSGSILARGAGIGAGGFVETSGHLLNINAATVDTGGGTWLLDPYNVTIVGTNSNATGTGFSTTYTPTQASAIKNSTIATALNAGNNVVITTGNTGTSSNGNITVNAGFTWTTGKTLTLNAAGNIVINAGLTATNARGGLVLDYGQATPTGAGASYAINAAVSLAAGLNFTTMKGSSGQQVQYNVITTEAALQNINFDANNRGLNYALGTNIIATGNFTPIGSNSGNVFTGIFEGLGHTISALTISESSTSNVGLFGYATGATIRDVGLVDENVAGKNDVGGLVGELNGGTITNSYVRGTVHGSGTNAGGLVGLNHAGTITGSYATGNVTGSSSNVGGLVGYNTSNGTISGSYATGTVIGTSYVGGLAGRNNIGGTITGSYAAATVSGSGNAVGGLAGSNDSTITDSYATGKVTDSGQGSLRQPFGVGGLVGSNEYSTIKDAYATGAVTGTGYIGGLVGFNLYGAITDGYWDSDTAGQPTAGVGSSNNGNVTGVSSVTLAGRLPSGFSSSVWTNAGGQTTPYLIGTEGLGPVSGVVFLASDASATPTPYTVLASQAQLQGISTLGLSGNYALGADITASGNFTPIGTYTTNGGNPNNAAAFTGIFEGLGHTVSGLTIHDSGISNVGLFGYAVGATIRDIGLTGESVTGSNSTGGLVGGGSGVTITNSYVQGAVGGFAYVGGLVGDNLNGTITGSYATGTVSGANNVIGGLVGANSNGTISDSYATAAVTAISSNAGGLVGLNNGGTITDGYATGHVTGASNVGGLAGLNSNGTITGAYATAGAVSGTIHVGGLVGRNVNGAVSDVYATGAVTGSSNVGGLVGLDNGGTITGAYATGNVTDTGNGAGGLVGTNHGGTITDAYATGAVTGSSNVGGLVGESQGRIIDVYATGVVTGTGDVGGLVGSNSNAITDGYWDVTTTGQVNGVGSNLGSATVTGLTTAEWLTNAAAVENVFTAANWATGYPYPVLKGLPYIVITGSASQAQGAALGTVTTSTVQNGSGVDESGLISGNITWLSTAGTNASVGSYQLGGSGAAAAGYQVTYGGTDTVTAAAPPAGGTTSSGGSTTPAGGSSGSSSTPPAPLPSTTAQSTPAPTPTVTVSPTGTITVQISETAPDFGFLGDIVASLSGGGAPLSTVAVNSGLYKQLIAATSGGGGGNGFELVIIIDGGVKKPPVHLHVALSQTPPARQEAAATTHRFD